MLLATIRLAASDMVTAAAAAAASAAGGLLAAGGAEGRRGAGLTLAMSRIMTVAAASAGLLTVREACGLGLLITAADTVGAAGGR